MSDNGQQVPLIERLRRVPAVARVLEYTPNPLGYDTTSIPVGALCREAADRIAELESKLAAEREARGIDTNRLLCGLAASRERREAAEAELAAERARSEAFAKLLAGIHALLYPPPIKMGDGRAMLFRPQNLDLHAVLQELSDRIRALPDELADFGPKHHKD